MQTIIEKFDEDEENCDGQWINVEGQGSDGHELGEIISTIDLIKTEKFTKYRRRGRVIKQIHR